MTSPRRPALGFTAILAAAGLGALLVINSYRMRTAVQRAQVLSDEAAAGVTVGEEFPLGGESARQLLRDCRVKSPAQIAFRSVHNYPVTVEATGTGERPGYTAARGEAGANLAADAKRKFARAAERIAAMHSTGGARAVVYYIDPTEEELERSQSNRYFDCTPQPQAHREGENLAKVLCVMSFTRDAVACVGEIY